MIRFFLVVCACAEGFLLWFLVALIREYDTARHIPWTADRTRHGSVGRREGGSNDAECIAVLK